MADDSTKTTATLAPISSNRRIRDDLEDKIPKPYLGRALVAADIEHPNGTPKHGKDGLSVLQQHVSFFDQNKDGIIYPCETYAGFRRMGFNILFSIILALVFNLVFSYHTLPGWIPSPLFPIYIVNIHQAKHGSDTGVYDTEGRFVTVYFENMFSKYAQTVPDKMTLREIWNMTEGNRDAFDIIGGIINKAEWGFVYFIAKDDDGFLSKEAMRCLFDGSLFEYLAKKN